MINKTWEKLDHITVKDLRSRLEEVLESQIETLSKLIRQGYHNRYQSEKYLQETIGNTLTQLDNLHAQAGLLELFKK